MSARTMGIRFVVVIAVLMAAACSFAMAGTRTTNIRLGKTTYGRYDAPRLQDAAHYPIYISTHDVRDKSRCTGSCALTFAPVIAHGTPKALDGVKQKLLGTIPRGRHEKQVTYNHHPLYTSTTDAPGSAIDDGCEFFKARWYVLDKTGTPDKRYKARCTGGY